MVAVLCLLALIAAAVLAWIGRLRPAVLIVCAVLILWLVFGSGHLVDIDVND